MPVGCGMFW
ncbi:rCG50868, partial [Rattus norvegicus]